MHAGETPAVFTELQAAREAAWRHVDAELRHAMVAAGAPVFEVKDEWDETSVDLGETEMFVEGTLRLTASGRPHLA